MTSRPPLTMRIRPRIWVALDYLLAACCAVLVYGILFRPVGLYRLHVTVWYAMAWLPPLLAVWVSAPVAVRRKYPLAALAVALAGGAAILAVGGEISRGPFVPLALVLFLVAVACPGPTALAGLGGSLALMLIQALTLHVAGNGSGNAIASGLVLILAWLAGYMARQRRAYAARLRQQVAEVAVTEERLRIARELHDVVAHSLTVVAVQAGFAEYVFDRQPGQTRSALAAIQTVTREALADMQRMLGALRRAGPGEEDGMTGTLAPTAGLADLDRLVAGTAGAGVQVDVRRAGQARAVPAGVDLSAFRIVQEALTNVVKHSGASSCQVSIDYRADGLAVEITDPGGEPSRAPAGLAVGAGHGIAGMAERVSLCGGDFTAAPLPVRGFRVAARFPLPGPGQ
ncbi:MAG TPA: sensor histidine kinase [Streptosporangiaceae bacterium]